MKNIYARFDQSLREINFSALVDTSLNINITKAVIREIYFE